MEKLTEEQVNEQLKNLNGWKYINGSIVKTFYTRGYPETLGFAVSAGAVCQKLNHHPDHMILRFKEVELSFSTHSVGGITIKDIETALLIEKLPL